jgi:hypothetical protein
MGRRMNNSTLARKFIAGSDILKSELRRRIARAIEACPFNISNEYFAGEVHTLDHVDIPGVGDAGLRGIYKILGGNGNRKSVGRRGTNVETPLRYSVTRNKVGGDDKTGWHN